MNIGFDLDKIFIDYPPLVPAVLIDRLYKKSSDGTLAYRIPSKPEQIFRLLTHHPLLRPPITANMEFVKNPKQKNQDKYYLISSRFGFLKNRTEAIVAKYHFDKIFDGMYFNYANDQPHIFKNGVVSRLKLDRYVDDDLPLLQFLAPQNPKVDFYWLNNRTTKVIEKNLFAITDLSAIIQK